MRATVDEVPDLAARLQDPAVSADEAADICCRLAELESAHKGSVAADFTASLTMAVLHGSVEKLIETVPETTVFV